MERFYRVQVEHKRRAVRRTATANADSSPPTVKEKLAIAGGVLNTIKHMLAVQDLARFDAEFAVLQNMVSRLAITTPHPREGAAATAAQAESVNFHLNPQSANAKGRPKTVNLFAGGKGAAKATKKKAKKKDAKPHA
mmetsp:Transcript_5427/g.13784  ORF Transcript_5427/g.13784 Transcript_5427/m.13784 type:complete len:137 (+) Transcript_5427:3562-3972(+)